jgi:putative adhesin
MTKSVRFPSLALAFGLLATLLLTAARGEEGTTTVKFSDPSKPGTLKIAVGRGEVRIKGEDTAEITVKSEAKPLKQAPRKDGLRVISASSTFELSEKDNVITLDAMADGWKGGGAGDFRITVPRNTRITVANSLGGDITCSGVAGDLDITSLGGEIRLDDVVAGAVVNTMNGEIHANIHELHDGKPLSFTSMNGEVVLRVPAEAKANLRLRTQNGSVLTDFDDKALVTKTESSPRQGHGKGPVVIGGFNEETREAIREAARQSAAAMHDAAQAMKDAAQAAHEGFAAAAEAVAPAAPPAPPAPGTAAEAPRAPRMPKLPAVTLTGGKLVSGTLNGGGPEISVATMNGDVTLRQLEKK